jgi:hypothetical protein
LRLLNQLLDFVFLDLLVDIPFINAYSFAYLAVACACGSHSSCGIDLFGGHCGPLRGDLLGAVALLWGPAGLLPVAALVSFAIVPPVGMLGLWFGDALLVPFGSAIALPKNESPRFLGPL